MEIFSIFRKFYSSQLFIFFLYTLNKLKELKILFKSLTKKINCIIRYSSRYAKEFVTNNLSGGKLYTKLGKGQISLFYVMDM